MRRLKELTEQQRADRNPGHELGDFLLRHSNYLEYLVGQLEAYLGAARADLEDERRRNQSMFSGWKKQRGGGR